MSAALRVVGCTLLLALVLGGTDAQQDGVSCAAAGWRWVASCAASQCGRM